MKCKNCKYKINLADTYDTWHALCSYPDSYFPITVDDDCYFLLKKEFLKCDDCYNLNNDYACLERTKEDSAFFHGKLCSGYTDRREMELIEFCSFWKAHDYYDRIRINKLLDEFEEEYRKLQNLD